MDGQLAFTGTTNVDAREITPDAWRRRPQSQRVLERACHALTYPLRGAGAVD